MWSTDMSQTVTLAEGVGAAVPLQWATTQNNLGNALATLGERTHD
jgi:hypothetical protein